MPANGLICAQERLPGIDWPVKASMNASKPLHKGGNNMSRIHGVLFACSLFASSVALAQTSPANWPTRPVTLVIPYAPGSATETDSRLYANKMSENLGQQFVLDFKPGGSTLIAAQHTAKAPGDGYTLMVVTATFPLLPLMFKDSSFDIIKSFTGISQMSERSTLFVISNSLPASNVKEYIAYAKANPGKINVGTSGQGGTQHLHGVWMHGLMGIEPTYIHYKGIGPMIPDLIAGRVQMGTMSVSASLGHVKAGKMRILGYGGKRRFEGLPDVPTIAEQGVTGFEYVSWLGMLAPSTTPAPLVNRINAELVKAAKSPDVVAYMKKIAAEIVASSPAEFQRQINSEVERWQALVKKTGFTFGN
jgi:tripartite-type tricarboxylate transporter receptor subunit TctC